MSSIGLRPSRARSNKLPISKHSPVEEKFPAYNNFGWESIKKFLDKIFPNCTDYHEKKTNDQWVFQIPRLLTLLEKDTLRGLRDQGKRPLRPDSPE